METRRFWKTGEMVQAWRAGSVSDRSSLTNDRSLSYLFPDRIKALAAQPLAAAEMN